MNRLARVVAESTGAVTAAFASAPPTIADDTLVWAFRGIIGLAFLLVLHQLREANKKLNTIAPVVRKVLRLETHVLSVARILVDGAEEYGRRESDPVVLNLKKDIERELGGIPEL